MTITPTATDLLDESTWLEYRALAAPPLHATPMLTTDETRHEFIRGAEMLRLWNRPPRAGDGGRGPTPIQLVVADVLNAGERSGDLFVGILEPRRTSKTTSVQAVMLGRGENREDYIMGWTMCTTGAKAGERFREDIVKHLRRVWPGDIGAPYKINVGKGTEHVQWDNGSKLAVYAPGGDGYRSGGFNIAFVDEGGEADPELSEDLTTAVPPTMDTIPGAQFIVAGTGAKYRQGNILWDTLEDPDAVVLRHAIPDTTDPEELADWEPTDDNPRGRMRELIELAHPGVGWTTPIAAVKRQFGKMARDKFLAEYGGIFGSEGGSTTLIPPALWEAAGVEVPPPTSAPADRFSLAIAVHPDSLWASAAVAWRFEEPDDLVSVAEQLDGGSATPKDDKIAVALLLHQKSTHGFAEAVLSIARKYHVPIVYDQLSQAAGAEAEVFNSAAPRPALTLAKTADVGLAATKFLNLLSEKRLVHFRGQRQMQHAAEIAIKRTIGSAGRFGFGRPKDDPSADITPLEAASLALHFLGDAPVRLDPKSIIEFD